MKASSYGKRVSMALLAMAPLLCFGQQFSAAATPLPTCSAPDSLYLSRYYPGTDSGLPKYYPQQGGSDIYQVQNTGNSPTSTLSLTGVAGTVAMGMGLDGALYAMGALDNYSTRYQLQRYAGNGVTSINLGLIGLPPFDGSNYNAADIDLSTARVDAATGRVSYPGDLIVGHLHAGGPMNQLYRIGIAPDDQTNTYQLLQTITLTRTGIADSKVIPGAISGDFAISPDGTKAYGISWQQTGGPAPSGYPGVDTPSSIPWIADLKTGVVNIGSPRTYGVTGSVTVTRTGFPPMPPILGVAAGVPYGAAAYMANGKLAFYFNGISDVPSYYNPISQTTIQLANITPFVMVLDPATFLATTTP